MLACSRLIVLGFAHEPSLRGVWGLHNL
jgi:hypothetical protein